MESHDEAAAAAGRLTVALVAAADAEPWGALRPLAGGAQLWVAAGVELEEKEGVASIGFVVPGGVAARDGRLAAGDTLLSVEGVACLSYTAALTANVAPMLAVLFVGCRMRVLWLTQGRGNPPEWVQMCMHMCTYAVLLMTLCVCIIPVFTGEALNIDLKTGQSRQECGPFRKLIAATCFTVLKYIIMIFLYVGVLCAI